MSTKYCINCGAACMQTMLSCPTCGNRNFSVSPVTKPSEAPPLRGAQTGAQDTKLLPGHYRGIVNAAKRSLFGVRGWYVFLAMALVVIVPLMLVVPELFPNHPPTTGDREFTVDRGWNGHFYLTAYVNGKSVNFLVDTGATDVFLTAGDAKRVGFNLDLLTYNQPYEMASGTVHAATVRLKEIRIGSIQARNVGGSVIPDNDKVSLLGMSFLNRLSGFEINGNTMVLKP